MEKIPSMVGTVIKDRYRLDKKLGSGGYGTVFRALDLTTSTPVALKVMAFMKEGDVAAVNQELAAYHLLSRSPDCNPHIICLLDYIIGDDFVYLVSELMDGDLYDNRPVDPAQVVALIHDCLSGLAFIHEKKLAHLDIKPENILVRGSTYKIGDLGLACSDVKRDGLDECEVAGTWAYVAPELDWKTHQFKPIDIAAAQRSDVWALGATFYAALTGDMPYNDGSNVAGMTQSMVTKFSDTLSYGLASGKAVSEVVNLMLRVDPTERPTARELLAMFDGESKECELHDGTKVKPSEIKGLLDSMKINYSRDASYEELCGLLRKRLQCSIKGLKISDETGKLLKQTFGVEGTLSQACKHIDKMLGEKEKMYRRRITEMLHNALVRSAKYQEDGNTGEMKKLDVIIGEIVSLSSAIGGLDKSYLDDQRETMSLKASREPVGSISRNYLAKYDKYVAGKI